MADCPFNLEIQAYHDGELPSERRTAVEEHLAGCPACAAELAELKNLSAVFAAEPVAELSQIALHRLHRKIDNEMDRGLIRFGWALSGIAASILLVASGWLMKVNSAGEEAQRRSAAALGERGAGGQPRSGGARRFDSGGRMVSGRRVDALG